MPEACQSKATELYQKALTRKRAMAARIKGDGTQLADVEKGDVASLLRDGKTVESRLQAFIMQFLKMSGGQ